MTPIEQIKGGLTISRLWARLDPSACPKVGKMNLCPFHKEKTPSMSINRADDKFHCFGCGAGGTVIDFYMGIKGIKLAKDAVRELCEMLQIQGDTNYKVLKASKHHETASIQTPKRENNLSTTEPLDSKAREFLTRKGISSAVIDRLIQEGSLAFHGGILAFNYNSGVKLRYSYESSRENRWLRGGPIGGLWRLKSILSFRVTCVWVTEGETDCGCLLSQLPTNGKHEVVGIPAASWDATPKLAGLIGNNRKVILCLDDDNAGRIASDRLESAIRTSARNFEIYRFPWDKRPDSERENDDICKLTENSLKNLIDYCFTHYTLNT